jgi:hypothetical protein
MITAHLRPSGAGSIAAILISTAIGCGDVNSETAPEAIDQVSGALTPVQPGVRPTIYNFSPAQRTTLVNGILAFITPTIVGQHDPSWHNPSDGEIFLVKHHEYLNELESYLLTHNLTAFVPVPMWDPGTPIPTEFLVSDPIADEGPLNQNPNKPIPPEFARNKLCNFASTDDLAVSLEAWHDTVHMAVGGVMNDLHNSPAAPIFWLWHGLLDDIYHDRTWRCETLPSLLVAAN